MKKRSNSAHSLIKYFLFLLIPIIFLLASFVFRVQKIKCVIDSKFQSEICDQLHFLKNKSLFFTNFEKTQLYTSALVNEQGQVFEPIAITKQLPSTVIISLSRKDPKYKLTVDENKYLVNSYGYLVKDNDQFELVEVKLSKDLEKEIQEQQVNSELHQQILTFTQELSTNNIEVKDLYLDKDQSWIRVQEFKFLFDQQDDFRILVSKIRLIIENKDSITTASSAASTIKEIDLRFDLPVVRYE